MMVKSRIFIEKHFGILNVICILLVLLFSVLWGVKKQGYYIDEYYVYTFANGTQVGIDINNGEWNDTSRFVDQLVSEGDENFNFQNTYRNVESGVHPPMYYFLVHFMSSVFSGVFNKWIGISVNILLLIPIIILVKKLAWRLSGENELITLITILLYGLSPVTVSMVILTRMYLLLSLWTLLYAYIHIRDLDRDKLSPRFLIPVFICGFFGFLTQYFFVVIMFFITFVYMFYLLVFCRRVKDSVLYGITALLSLVSTYFVWPISYYHIFMGHRGTGAFSQARDVHGIGSRLITQLSWLNKMVFSGLLPVFVIILIVGTYLLVIKCIRNKKDSQNLSIRMLTVSSRGMILLGIASLLDFVVLSQIALTEGGITCCRQIYTAYALFLVLIPSGVYKTFNAIKNKSRLLPVTLSILSVIAVICLGYLQKNVLFVYEDEMVETDYAREHPDAKVVMFHADNGNYDSRIQELIMYPKVFFANANDLSTAMDKTISESDELLVYMSTDIDNQEECFESVFKQNPKIDKADHLWDSSSGFFSAYLMH